MPWGLNLRTGIIIFLVILVIIGGLFAIGWFVSMYIAIGVACAIALIGGGAAFWYNKQHSSDMDGDAINSTKLPAAHRSTHQPIYQPTHKSVPVRIQDTRKAYKSTNERHPNAHNKGVGQKEFVDNELSISEHGKSLSILGKVLRKEPSMLRINRQATLPLESKAESKKLNSIIEQYEADLHSESETSNLPNQSNERIIKNTAARIKNTIDQELNSSLVPLEIFNNVEAYCNKEMNEQSEYFQYNSKIKNAVYLEVTDDLINGNIREYGYMGVISDLLNSSNLSTDINTINGFVFSRADNPVLYNSNHIKMYKDLLAECIDVFKKINIDTFVSYNTKALHNTKALTNLLDATLPSISSILSKVYYNDEYNVIYYLVISDISNVYNYYMYTVDELTDDFTYNGEKYNDINSVIYYYVERMIDNKSSEISESPELSYVNHTNQPYEFIKKSTNISIDKLLEYWPVIKESINKILLPIKISDITPLLNEYSQLDNDDEKIVIRYACIKYIIDNSYKWYKGNALINTQNTEYYYPQYTDVNDIIAIMHQNEPNMYQRYQIVDICQEICTIVKQQINTRIIKSSDVEKICMEYFNKNPSISNDAKIVVIYLLLEYTLHLCADIYRNTTLIENTSESTSDQFLITDAYDKMINYKII